MRPRRRDSPLGALLRLSIHTILISTIITISLLTPTSTAHMELTNPPPLLSKSNKYTTNPDYSMTSPLSASGSNFPCKGYLSLLGTPQAAAVTAYTPGQSYKMTISGGAPHNGGSCQASLSLDGGRTFHVIHSYIGGCPGLGPSSDFAFTIPADVPSTKGAIFSWTWFNYLGNREMYQNCAVVDIVSTGERGGSNNINGKGTSPFAARPELFRANIGDGCGTVEARSLRFPDPGPDVDVSDAGAVGPTGGSCQASVVGGGGGSSGGSSSSGTSQGGGNGSGNSGDGNGGGSSAGAQGVGLLPLPLPRSGTWTPGNTWPSGFPSSAGQRYSYDMSIYVCSLVLGVILP